VIRRTALASRQLDDDAQMIVSLTVFSKITAHRLFKPIFPLNPRPAASTTPSNAVKIIMLAPKA
jgi:hypothetical protein